MTLQISNEAQSDLTEIWEYTYETWSLSQADTYYSILIEGINAIVKEPNIGRSYENVKSGYFGYKVKSHIIFYKIKRREIMQVIRILHQRMDFPNRLK